MGNSLSQSDNGYELYKACKENDTKTALKLITQYNFNIKNCKSEFDTKNEIINMTNNKNYCYNESYEFTNLIEKSIEINHLRHRKSATDKLTYEKNNYTNETSTDNEYIKTNYNSIFSYTDSDNCNSLTWACKNKMNEVALELIKNCCFDSEYVNKYFSTTLILASKNKMSEVVSELLSSPNMTNQLIENCDNLITLLMINELLEPFKILLNINIKINDFNEYCLINFIEKHNLEIEGEITNINIIKLLCIKNKKHLVKEEIIKNYDKYVVNDTMK